MGIFGGFDLNSIKEYCKFSIEMAQNNKYENLWNYEQINPLSVSCMI